MRRDKSDHRIWCQRAQGVIIRRVRLFLLILRYLHLVKWVNIVSPDWDLEISKRFAQPLFSETNEFPDAETIHNRMVPICYQEGLSGGCGTACSDLMTVAAEVFVKEQLSELMKRVRSDGPNYIRTAKFRRHLEKEEDLVERGELKRNAYGLLPTESEVEARRRPFNREDLRLAALMGNSYLSQHKTIHEMVINAPFVEEEYDEEDVDEETTNLRNSMLNGNGVNGVNGYGRDHGAEGMQVDEVEWGWSGGYRDERGRLNDELDDVLAGI
jgi:transcriptional coactivator HFI1/ADA1